MQAVAGAAQNFGYGVNGLTGEVVGFVPISWNTDPNSHQWLPWVTNALIDPLQRMQDTFGYTSIADVLAHNTRRSFKR